MIYQPDVTKYFALALDPIHVGTGGYRLGRVDMAIVREPGTDVPKIPGTSLAGACRSYAAMQETGKFPGCAGQGQEHGDNKGHCGQADCPICIAFGFSKGDKGSFQGLAQFSDARLVLFPVNSLAGPVWVTCPYALQDMFQSNGQEGPDDGEVCLCSKTSIKVKGKLNLGWLMLNIAECPFSLNSKLDNVPDEIKKRIVLVSNKMFSHIVNDNLEVRTSVSIDPQTGAASEGALFTYEALPRGSILVFEVVLSNPKYYRIKGSEPLKNDGGVPKVKSTIANGLKLLEALGVGGMSTRGMGRLRVLGLDGEA
jgi:CRISPR-associated protein Cmr4